MTETREIEPPDRDSIPGQEVDTPPWVGRLEFWLGSPGLLFLTAMGATVVVTTLSAGQVWLNWRGLALDAPYMLLFAAEGVEWSTWAAALPGIVALDRWLRSRSKPVPTWTAVHLGSALSLFIVLTVFSAFLNSWLDPESGVSLGAFLVKRALYKLPGVFGMYAFVLAVVWLLRALVRQERLHQVVISARLSNLRAQLQPHFLFNTLNSTASLVRSGDREGAIESLVDLSDLLRRSLSAPVRHRVPLREELAFLTTYLAIQKRRFGDRLRVSVQVDEGVSDARVPFLVLQPVVENAVRHGLNLQKRPGEIHVTVRREGDGLIIEVQDSGSEETPSHGFGIGLENLRERLGHLYGSMFRLSLQRRRGGTCVSLAIPYVVQDD